MKNEKPRGITGKDVEPFVAQIHICPEAGLRWEILDNKEMDSEEFYGKVVELSAEGHSIRKIEEILQIKRSKVHALIKKARENGDLLIEN